MITGFMTWHVAANYNDLRESDALGVLVAGQHIALYRIADEVFATSNVCTHEFALLSDGFVEGECIECPLHAARFDIRSGKVLGAPATAPLAIYPAKIEGGKVLIEL